MSNTYSATSLKTPELVHLACSIIGATLPSGLARSVTMRDLPRSDKPASDMVIKLVRSVGATLSNPTNFEQGDAVIDPLTATPVYLCQSWNVSNADRMGGLRPEDLLFKNTEKFALSLWGQVAALATVGNFAVGWTGLAVNFGWGDSAALVGKLKAFPQRHLIASPDYVAQLSSSPPGLERLGDNLWTGGGWTEIKTASDWSAAGPNVVGIALSPSAIACGTGLPVKFPGESVVSLTQEAAGIKAQLDDPALEQFKIYFCRWFSLPSRSEYNSLDSFIGAVVADSNGAFLIKSA